MGAALIRPLPTRLLPINRPAAVAAGRDFLTYFDFNCCISLTCSLKNHYCYV